MCPLVTDSEDLKETTTITVRVVPRSSKTEIAGDHDGVLKIKLKAPPVGGAANEELIRFLSKTFHIPKANVQLISGLTGRNKRIRLAGVAPSQIADLVGKKLA